MTTLVDLGNRALSEIGARATITAIDNTTPAGQQVGIWIDTLRQQLLRMAPWGFARRTAALTLLGELTDIPPASPYPWQFKYAYPADCFRMNYILPKPPTATTDTPVVGVPIVPYAFPSRNCRYLVSNDIDDADAQIKVVLSNVRDAVAVYVADVIDPDLMDVGFQAAWVAALAAKLVQPLTGNAGMKGDYVKLANMYIDMARVQDGNEAVPSTDHTPDWIATRGVPSANAGWIAGAPFLGGDWYWGFDGGSWGM